MQLYCVVALHDGNLNPVFAVSISSHYHDVEPRRRAAKPTLTGHGMDPTRALEVRCGVWHQVLRGSSWGLSRSEIFVQTRLYVFQIWGIWRPSKHLGLFAVFLKPFLSHF